MCVIYLLDRLYTVWLIHMSMYKLSLRRNVDGTYELRDLVEYTKEVYRIIYAVNLDDRDALALVDSVLCSVLIYNRRCNMFYRSRNYGLNEWELDSRLFLR